MKHVIEHDLSDDLAKRATERAYETYRERFEKYNPTATWVTDRRAEVGFEAKGIKLQGSIALEPGQIELELKVPFAFKIFQKRALQIIEEEIEAWIARARAGELDEVDPEEGP